MAAKIVCFIPRIIMFLIVVEICWCNNVITLVYLSWKKEKSVSVTYTYRIYGITSKDTDIVFVGGMPSARIIIGSNVYRILAQFMFFNTSTKGILQRALMSVLILRACLMRIPLISNKIRRIEIIAAYGVCMVTPVRNIWKLICTGNNRENHLIT